jgi:hypothetical protein
MPQPIRDAAFAFPHAVPRLEDGALLEYMHDLSEPARISGWHNIGILVIFTLASLYGFAALIPNPLIHPSRSALALPLFLLPVVIIASIVHLLFFFSVSSIARTYAYVAADPKRFIVTRAHVVRKGWNLTNDLVSGFRSASQSRFFFALDGDTHLYTSPYFSFGLLQDIRKGDGLYVAVDTQRQQPPVFLGFVYRDRMDRSIHMTQNRLDTLLR